jgi:hypothetical protein
MRCLVHLALTALLIAGCSSSDASPAQGAGGSSAEAGTDAAADHATKDTAAADTTSETMDAKPACEPQSVSSWTPTWQPPSGKYLGKCGDGEAVALIDACFGDSATEQTCTDAETKYAACNDCLFTDDTASQWGPIVYYSKVDFYDRNEGGCLALLTDDATATGCGAKVNALYDCGLASCGPVCPVATDADFEALNSCITAAMGDAAICKPYADDADACYQAALTAHPEASACVWGDSEDLLDVFKRFGELFCGAGASDGGSDVGSPDADAPAADAPAE